MKTNYLALAACAVANIILGMAWFGVFAEPWMAGHGVTMEQAQNMENPALPYLVSITVALISAFILNLIFQRMGVRGWMDGLKSGAAVGLFGLLGTIVSHMYAMKPFSLSMVDGGYAFLQFAIFGAIIGGWQKK